MKLGSAVIAQLAIADYRKSVRAIVRSLWLGAFTLAEFQNRLNEAILRNYELAWREGAMICGVEPDERTTEETGALNQLIGNSLLFVIGFGETIEAGSKARGGKLGKHLKRAEIWINRYKEVFNTAKQMSCADKKMIWVLGVVEKHCKSCLKLSGKVKRASQWEAADIRPQHPRLECKGFRCDCDLKPTRKKMSMGPLPKIP